MTCVASMGVRGCVSRAGMRHVDKVQKGDQNACVEGREIHGEGLRGLEEKVPAFDMLGQEERGSTQDERGSIQEESLDSDPD